MKKRPRIFPHHPDLTSKGVSVVYISHRMEEILEICSTSILRRTLCGDQARGEVSKDELISKMVGRKVTNSPR